MVATVVSDYDDFKPLADDRAAYWRDGVVIVRNPATRDGGPAFVPDTSYDYCLNL